MYKLAGFLFLYACAGAIDDPRLDMAYPHNEFDGQVLAEPFPPANPACALWDDPDALTMWAHDNVPVNACFVIRCPPSVEFPDGFGLHVCNVPDQPHLNLFGGIEAWAVDINTLE